MGSAFHLLCPTYSGPLTSTALPLLGPILCHSYNTDLQVHCLFYRKAQCKILMIRMLMRVLSSM